MTPKCYYLFGEGWRLPIYDELLGLFHEDTLFFLPDYLGASLVTQSVKNLPAMQEIWV